METHQEIYKGYGIQVFVRSLGDGVFNAFGKIRHVIKRLPPANDLPFICSFDTGGERHPTVGAALDAGIGFAKKKIDAV